MPEPDIYQIDKDVTELKVIVKNLNEGMKTLRETTQETNSTIEKFIAKQDVLNERLTDNVEKLTEKTSNDKKELYQKVNDVEDKFNDKYIEIIKENNKQDISDEQQNTRLVNTKFDAIKWGFGILLTIIGTLIGKFILK
jgi:hypothetical protein